MAEKIQPGKIDGALSAAGFRFGIVVSRFNSFITERLLTAALDALERAGAASKDVDVVRVPGAFELPLTSKKLAQAGKYGALRLCLFGNFPRTATRADGYGRAGDFLRVDGRYLGAGD